MITISRRSFGNVILEQDTENGGLLFRDSRRRSSKRCQGGVGFSPPPSHAKEGRQPPSSRDGSKKCLPVQVVDTHTHG